MTLGGGWAGWQLAIGFYAGTLGIVVLFIHPWLSYMINGREPIIWSANSPLLAHSFFACLQDLLW